ncbi:MAG TPA: tripartite tricarboxylate transporter substrate binding protein [Syntrophales bacterium]|nr:tripartite tricarboxylate transporter substrate binding protein [Syntrophales bacterium]
MKGKRIFTVLLSLLLIGLWGSAATAAETYPAKPVTIVVPFAAGGAVDVTIRIIAEEAEKDLGQKILVVNKPGAGAAEGQGFVARANPDGYTLLAMTSSVVTNTLTKKVDFTIDSFAPITLYCFDPEVLYVNASTPFKSLEDLIAAGKKGVVTNATHGHSTSHHIASMLMEEKAGIKFKYVHTKGATEQVPMIAGGHVQSGLGAYGEARSMVDQGKLRLLGVMSEERDPRIPNVPTFKEKGYPMLYGAWRGISGPKGLSPEILDRLTKAFKAALDKKEVKEKFAKADYPIMYKGPKEFAAYLKADFESNKQILSQLK